jgi:hypothetical protein
MRRLLGTGLLRPLPMLHSVGDTSVPPEQRPPEDVLIPVLHPPDALVTARASEASKVRPAPAPAVNWALLALVLAF